MNTETRIEAEVMEVFQTEVDEHLQRVESILLSLLETAERPQEEINSLFRSFHTIKGTSEMFGFGHVARFTHTAENLLSRARKEPALLSPSTLELLLQCKDFIQSLMGLTAAQYQDDTEVNSRGNALVETLKCLDPDYTENAKSSSPLDEAEVQVASKSSSGSVDKSTLNYNIQLNLHSSIFENRLDPYPTIRYLKKHGVILDLVANQDRLPSLEQFDPEKCYLNIKLNFSSPLSKREIENIFEFIAGDCDLIIEKAIGKNELIPETLEKSPSMPDNKINEIERKATGNSNNGGALERNHPGSAVRKSIRSFRIEADRIDTLINLVSELVMSGAQISQIASSHNSMEMIEAGFQLGRIITGIRESTLRLRMVPVSDIFERLKRAVYDAAKNCNKTVNLRFKGGETELDKTVIEQIADPLMHIVRNSVDHGIENPQDRKALGKSSEGNIYLEASNEAGEIIIEIRDDGSGFSRERISAKAVEIGLVDKNQILDEKDIQRLIFEPGFSTAKKITNISGRGVGLDVVKRNIEALSGKIDAESHEGRGSSFRISLPLTLATIDGFLVGIGDNKYVIPLDSVKICLELDRDSLHSDQRYFIEVNGVTVPYMDLRSFFQSSTYNNRRAFVVVVQQGHQQSGFVVNEILGEMQSVIKPLGSLLGKVKGLSGSTILGNGEIAMILDVAALTSMAESLAREGKYLSKIS